MPAAGTQRATGPAAVLVLAGAAWALTAVQMESMHAGPPGGLGRVGWFTATWLLMMAAMMLPSLASALPARVRAVGPFVAGYLLAWTAAGLAAYGAAAVVRALGPGFLAGAETDRYASGGVIAAAALYQLTPLKGACLRRCRAPHVDGRPGRPGGRAVNGGLRHGVACVGCCWALMAVLFALGMSLAWMAVVAGVVAAEKLLPCRRVTGLGVAVLLAVLGAAVAFAPGSVPGLTAPGETPSHHEMGGGKAGSPPT